MYTYICIFEGNLEDKTVPTLVKALKDHKIVGVSCGSGDSHTIALEDNGNVPRYMYMHIVHVRIPLRAVQLFSLKLVVCLECFHLLCLALLFIYMYM